MKISKDIQDLINKDQKQVRVSKLLYKVVIFLAFVGLLAIIAGSVNSCQTVKTPPPTLELGR